MGKPSAPSKDKPPASGIAQPLSQAKLSDISGSSPSKVKTVEKGGWPLEKAKQDSHILHVSP